MSRCKLVVILFLRQRQPYGYQSHSGQMCQPQSEKWTSLVTHFHCLFHVTRNYCETLGPCSQSLIWPYRRTSMTTEVQHESIPRTHIVASMIAWMLLGLLLDPCCCLIRTAWTVRWASIDLLGPWKLDQQIGINLDKTENTLRCQDMCTIKSDFWSREPISLFTWC